MKIFPEHANVHNLVRTKFGIDPTFNRLHIGHLVPLAWLKKQEKRDVTIVLGTITARLGDPSGQDTTRPILSKFQVEQNAEAIRKQVKRVLPFVRLVEQAELSATQLLEISSHFSVSKVMSRDGFKKRESIGLHELSVPILQAMDSVVLQTQLEVGGEDQLFNFQLTRDVQVLHNQKPEACLMFPIIRGTDGEKMSKSKDNCIWLDDPQIGRRILSISDEVMDEWFPLFCDDEPNQHPFERKKQLAAAVEQLCNE